MNKIFQGIVSFFRPLTPAQKFLFGLFSFGVVATLGFLFYWALQPSYTVLFGSLSPDSAQTIVEELKNTGVPYELKDNGKSIYVPRDQVYDLRLKFASEGATDSGYQGYELFDQNALGMTDFMQRINKKRALEGELARTINNIEQIESSRIHIVLPERSPFQQSTIEPSASVILNMKRGRTLNADQIEGIGSLIAGSVEGLTNENVVIVDQKGKRISDNTASDSEIAVSNSQMKIKQDTETYLTRKGQSMLDLVLGTGNSILRVSTEHNFDRLIRESDLIDPESRIVISEEKRTTKNADKTQEPLNNNTIPTELDDQIAQQNALTTQAREDESSIQVKNYEVAKTREQYEQTVGAVTRISASILLNHKPKPVEQEDGTVVMEYEAFTEAEINEIKEVVIPALGIQEDRGDAIQVTQIQFMDPYVEEPGPETFFQEPLSIMDIIRWSIMGLVMITISFMVYRVSKNFQPQLDPLLATNTEFQHEGNELENPMTDASLLEGQTREPAIESDIYSAKLTEEAKLLTNSDEISEAIREFVEENASEAANVVRSMMNEWTTT